MTMRSILLHFTPNCLLSFCSPCKSPGGKVGCCSNDTVTNVTWPGLQTDSCNFHLLPVRDISQQTGAQVRLRTTASYVCLWWTRIS